MSIRSSVICIAMLAALGLVRAADCPSGQQWIAVVLKCVLDCKGVAHALTTNSDASGCICEIGYQWDGNSCVIDCSHIENTEGNVSAGECPCLSNYVWSQTNKRCEALKPVKED